MSRDKHVPFITVIIDIIVPSLYLSFALFLEINKTKLEMLKFSQNS